MEKRWRAQWHDHRHRMQGRAGWRESAVPLLCCRHRLAGVGVPPRCAATAGRSLCSSSIVRFHRLDHRCVLRGGSLSPPPLHHVEITRISVEPLWMLLAKAFVGFARQLVAGCGRRGEATSGFIIRRALKSNNTNH